KPIVVAHERHDDERYCEKGSHRDPVLSDREDPPVRRVARLELSGFPVDHRFTRGYDIRTGPLLGPIKSSKPGAGPLSLRSGLEKSRPRSRGDRLGLTVLSERPRSGTGPQLGTRGTGPASHLILSRSSFPRRVPQAERGERPWPTRTGTSSRCRCRCAARCRPRRASLLPRRSTLPRSPLEST